MKLKKVCVEVTATFSKEGGVKPLFLVWEDGRKFDIERIKSMEVAPARVGAPLPVRYTCVIAGKEKWLYLEAEKMRWFVESWQSEG